MIDTREQLGFFAGRHITREKQMSAHHATELAGRANTARDAINR